MPLTAMMPITTLTEEQLEIIKSAWLDFEAVLQTQPASETAYPSDQPA